MSDKEQEKIIEDLEFKNPFKNKWFAFPHDQSKIVIPKDFKPRKNRKYHCQIEHTKKVYIFKNKKYTLSIATLIKTENSNDFGINTIMEEALRKAGVLKKFKIE